MIAWCLDNKAKTIRIKAKPSSGQTNKNGQTNSEWSDIGQGYGGTGGLLELLSTNRVNLFSTSKNTSNK